MSIIDCDHKQWYSVSVNGGWACTGCGVRMTEAEYIIYREVKRRRNDALLPLLKNARDCLRVWGDSYADELDATIRDMETTNG